MAEKKQKPKRNECGLNHLIEVKLTDEYSFSRICEVLKRIGIPNFRQKKLFQTAHILHKQGKYYIVHFKQMFMLDGKAAFIDRQDIDRLLRIVDLLVQWNLVTVEKSRYKPDIKDHVGIFVLSRSELSDWELVPKYKIGSKHFQK